jgi:LCP family protein required for cell wall assembly
LSPEPPVTSEPGERSPAVVALLSFLWPGLGQWYTARPGVALAFALPVVALAIAGLAIALRGIGQLAILFIKPESALMIAIIAVALGAWRLAALGEAVRAMRPAGAWRSGRSPVVVGILIVVIVASHAWVAVVAWAGYRAGSAIFVADPGPSPMPLLTPGPTTSGPLSSASPAPTPEPPTRINILLLGVDSAATRTTELTDTLLVASIDPTTGDVALVSFPRDISNFPLYDGRTFRGKINSLMNYVRRNPGQFEQGPQETVIRELGFLLGTEIQYYAAVDLAGFRRLIDEVGGVTIVNERAIADGRYDWMDGTRGFFLSAGTHTLNGRNALAYVRSRFSAGDNDFNRARRQQQVLLAVRTKLTTPEMIVRIPALFNVAAETVRTNFPVERLDEMVDIAAGVDNDDVFQVVLGPPYAIHPPTNTTGGIYTLRLDMDKLAELSIRIFGAQSAYADD